MTKIFIFSILPSIFFSYKVVDKARLSLYYYDRRKISSVNRVFLRLTIKKGGVFVKIAGIIAEYNPFPVSYTHLDVYKRQVLTCLIKGSIAQFHILEQQITGEAP